MSPNPHYGFKKIHRKTDEEKQGEHIFAHRYPIIIYTEFNIFEKKS